MGAFLEKPDTQKYNEHGSGNGLRYGVASMQGWRVEMEDAHCARLGLEEPLADWSYFAVFDGHAGSLVSAHCADNLLECILRTDEFKNNDVVCAIHTGFLRLDDKMRELPELSSYEDKSGSTAVCAFVSPRHIYIANCGDSRAVLARDGAPVFATCDHKPELPGEKQRIYRAGGSVMIQRVNGSLAVSRALGDYEYKNRQSLGQCEQLVSPEPEVYCRDRDDSVDEFLVLACDGVWDVMSNEALCSYVHSRLRLTDDLESIANQVIDTCLYKGSRDNMSIVLVVFPGAPTPSADAQRAEQQLDDTLRRRLTALVGRGDEVPTFPQALQLLSDEDLPGLPPGGGIASKRGILEKMYLELCPDNAYTINSADMMSL